MERLRIGYPIHEGKCAPVRGRAARRGVLETAVRGLIRIGVEGILLAFHEVDRVEVHGHASLIRALLTGEAVLGLAIVTRT
jgi:hypothetical protein